MKIIICLLAILITSCSQSKESEASSQLKDLGAKLPSNLVSVTNVEYLLDSIQSDFFSISLNSKVVDIPAIETDLGFTLIDGATHTIASNISPSYPWVVNVYRTDTAGISDIVITAKQPF